QEPPKIEHPARLDVLAVGREEHAALLAKNDQHPGLGNHASEAFGHPGTVVRPAEPPAQALGGDDGHDATPFHHVDPRLVGLAAPGCVELEVVRRDHASLHLRLADDDADPGLAGGEEPLLEPGRSCLVITDMDEHRRHAGRTSLGQAVYRQAGAAPSVNVARVNIGRARELAAAVERELDVRSRAVLAGRALRAAGARDRAVLLGPFVGEIGYELEYWIPFLRRELRRHRIERDQATVLTRGGAALWYRDFAAHAVAAPELLWAEAGLPRLEERRRLAGDLKQLRWEPFDRELVDLAREQLGDVTVVHPGYM